MKGKPLDRLTVRMTSDEMRQIKTIAQERDCSMAEAARLALGYGVPLVASSTSVNFRRYAQLLEFATASLGVIIRESHPDHEDHIKELVSERMERFHV